MKKSSKKSKFTTIGDLCERLNAQRRERAQLAYLEGPMHRAALIAESYGEEIARVTAGLRRGEIEPAVHVCNDDETFVRAVNGPLRLDYAGFVPGGEEADEEAEQRAAETLVTEEEFANMSDDQIGDYLLACNDCSLVTFVTTHTEDEVRIERYLKLLNEYLYVAAACAKGLGSSSGPDFLSVARLLMPRRHMLIDTEKDQIDFYRTYPQDEDARAAYARLMDAHNQLWIDTEYARLKPITMKSKRSRR